MATIEVKRVSLVTETYVSVTNAQDKNRDCPSGACVLQSEFKSRKCFSEFNTFSQLTIIFIPRIAILSMRGIFVVLTMHKGSRTILVF